MLLNKPVGTKLTIKHNSGTHHLAKIAYVSNAGEVYIVETTVTSTGPMILKSNGRGLNSGRLCVVSVEPT